MKIFSKQKFVSLLLTLAVCLSLVPLSVFAASETTAEEAPEISAELLASLPETLDAMAIAGKGHLSRLYNEETEMNTVVFDNGNGAQSIYIFGEDIKYIDSDGNTVDKSNKLEAVIGGYTNPKNDINVFYPMNIFDGITVDYKDYSINMVPAPDNTNLGNHIFATETATLASSDIRTEPDAVTYNGVFGGGTVVEYTQQFSGFKEVIGLAAYTGQTEFSFIITTNGLNLAINNGIAEFTDVETDEVIGHLGEIVMWDSNDNYYGGTYEIETIKPNDIYAVTIDASEMLNNPDTLFPVYIDPAFFLGQGSNTAVEEGSVYTASPYSGINYGANTTNGVGRINDVVSINGDRGTGLVFVKMPSLLQTISSDSVTAVYLSLATMYTPHTSIEIQANLAKSAWEENDIRYTDYSWTNSKHESDIIGDFVSTNEYTPTNNMSNIKRVPIDITYAWIKFKKSENIIPDNGIILSSPEAKGVAFYSSEHSNASLRPYVVMEVDAYNKNIDMVYRLKNSAVTRYLNVDRFIDYSNVLVNTTTTDTTDTYMSNYSEQFRFEYDEESNGYYIRTISSKNGMHRGLAVSATNDVVISHNNELFTIDFLGTDFYRLLVKSTENSTSEKVVSLKYMDSNTYDVCLEEYNGNLSQKWHIEPDYNAYEKRHYYKNLVYNLNKPLTGGAKDVIFPVPDYDYISSGFATRIVNVEENNITTQELDVHLGLDIEAKEDNPNPPIYCILDGEVVGRGTLDNSRGKYITIKTEIEVSGVKNEIFIIYMHMNSFGSYDLNDEVAAGAQIGTVGKTGAAGSNHLHISLVFETDTVKHPNAPQYSNSLDPMLLFSNIENLRYSNVLVSKRHEDYGTPLENLPWKE